MAVVPTPATFADGLAPSSQMNAGVRDVLRFLLAKPLAALRQTVAQSLTTAVYTALTFDVEDLDRNPQGTSQHDNVTNNSRFTVVHAGVYALGGGAGYATSSAGRRGCRWAVNGTFLVGTAVVLPANPSGTCDVPARWHLVALNVGDYVELQGFQDSGGALNTAVTATETYSNMTVAWESN